MQGLVLWLEKNIACYKKNRPMEISVAFSYLLKVNLIWSCLVITRITRRGLWRAFRCNHLEKQFPAFNFLLQQCLGVNRIHRKTLTRFHGRGKGRRLIEPTINRTMIICWRYCKFRSIGSPSIRLNKFYPILS